MVSYVSHAKDAGKNEGDAVFTDVDGDKITFACQFGEARESPQIEGDGSPVNREPDC